MFSRIGRVIFDHIEGIGIAIVAVSVFWLMGVAGADDFNTMQHVYTSVFPLILKTIIGLLGAGFGTVLTVIGGIEA